MLVPGALSWSMNCSAASAPWPIMMSFTDADRTGPDKHLVTGSLTGNLPGGTAKLRWRFALAGDSIQHLHIAP
jgi:hypothetical protein